MYGKRIVPILLAFGLVHMFVRHSQHGLADHRGDGEQRSPAGHHGDWQKRVPPLFEKWHQRAHDAQRESPSPAI